MGRGGGGLPDGGAVQLLRGYLPKVFPLHLRGTGGSFATNVGGRMFGTSAAYLTANILAPMFTGTTFEQVAKAAAITGGAAMLLGVCLSFLLPEPKGGGMEGH